MVKSDVWDEVWCSQYSVYVRLIWTTVVLICIKPTLNHFSAVLVGPKKIVTSTLVCCIKCLSDMHVGLSLHPTTPRPPSNSPPSSVSNGDKHSFCYACLGVKRVVIPLNEIGECSRPGAFSFGMDSTLPLSDLMCDGFVSLEPHSCSR